MSPRMREWNSLLTTSSIGCHEYLCNVMIHRDWVFLLAPLIMSFVHLHVHPLLEWIANDRIYDIGNIGSRQLLYLSLHYRQALEGPLVVGSEFQHGLYFQALEVRNVDVLYISLHDLPSFSSHDVSHVEDGHRLVAAQVGCTGMSEEPIHLALALVLGCECCSINSYFWWLLLIMGCLILLIVHFVDLQKTSIKFVLISIWIFIEIPTLEHKYL